MFAKDWGTTCGFCSKFSPATGYQLSLLGRFGTNWPMSRELEEEVLGLTTVSWFCKCLAISSIKGSLSEGGCEDCSMRNILGSLPSPDPNL